MPQIFPKAVNPLAKLLVLLLPLLFLMNDEDYLGPYTNGWVSNVVVSFVTVMGFVLAIVAIPLQIFGGS